MDALEKAIEAAGGLSELARRMTIKPQVVNNWRTRGVPAERVLAIEEAAGGVVTRFELAPEIHGEKPEGWTSPFTSTAAPVAQLVRVEESA